MSVNRVSIGSDNGLSPFRRNLNQCWVITGYYQFDPGLGTTFSELLVKNRTFSFKKMRLKMLSAKWRPFCPGEEGLNHWGRLTPGSLLASERACRQFRANSLSKFGDGLSSVTTKRRYPCGNLHYNDVIMSAMASQITSLTIVYSTVYSGTDQRKHQSSASLAFVRGNSPVNSPHKGPVTWKMFPLDDVITHWIWTSLL